MKTSPGGVKQLMLREGVRLTAYPDIRGILTWGVGHTSAAGPPEVFPGMRGTLDEALSVLARDLAPIEAFLNRVIRVPVTQNEWDAVISLSYNIGVGGFHGSSVLKNINAGSFETAANDFLLWDDPPALIGRRKGERAQFLRPDAPTSPKITAYSTGFLTGEAPVGSIAWIQDTLNATGAQPHLDVDGDFGPQTEKAVVDFQTRHGLFIDGVPGPKTVAALQAASIM